MPESHFMELAPTLKPPNVGPPYGFVFDQFVILLRNSVSQMVYKHAISTVVPGRMVRLPLDDEAEEEEE